MFVCLFFYSFFHLFIWVWFCFFFFFFVFGWLVGWLVGLLACLFVYFFVCCLTAKQRANRPVYTWLASSSTDPKTSGVWHWNHKRNDVTDTAPTWTSGSDPPSPAVELDAAPLGHQGDQLREKSVDIYYAGQNYSVDWWLNFLLVGLVAKTSSSRADDPGFKSCLRRDFFGVESYQ